MEKQQIYETIIQNLPIGFSIVDEKGTTVDFNEAAEKITGYSKEEVIGNPHLEIFHGTSDKNMCPLLKHSVHLKEPIEAIESTIMNKDGSPIILLITAAPVFNQEGTFVGGVELFRDITVVKKLEREQQNILSMLVHDMKNPVVASLGFLSRLLRGKVEKQQEHSYLELISDELKTVEGFITHYMDFVRLERKEYKPQPTPFDIVEVINKQIEKVKILGEEKNITIAAEFPADMVADINADKVMIERVITNLLDNAIKFTDAGGKIRIRLLSRDKDFLFEIQDTGIAIPKDQISYLFEPFYRGVREQKGSGLGLAISKTIIEAHGGKIWVESSASQGNTFSFSLLKT
jgi:PAS domain S-box-containing protein